MAAVHTSNYLSEGALAGPKAPGEQSFSMAVKVLIAGDLVGWDGFSQVWSVVVRNPIKSIQRESSELYTLDYL